MQSLSTKKKWAIAGALAGVVALIVALAIIIPAAQEQQREAKYVGILRMGPGDFSGIPDSQLAQSLKGGCQEIASGWDLGEAMDAAETNWQPGWGTITKEQYLANTKAMFQAAQAAC